MGKNETLSWLFMQPDDHRVWRVIEGQRFGTVGDDGEKLVKLADVARELKIDRTWLYRLGIKEACGKQFAGGVRYALSEVRRWLGTDQCRAEARSKGRKRGRVATGVNGNEHMAPCQTRGVNGEGGRNGFKN